MSSLIVYLDGADGSRRYLEEIQGQEEDYEKVSGGLLDGETISKSVLEDAARHSTLQGHGTAEERFWHRQQGKAETITIGKRYISKVCFGPGDCLTENLADFRIGYII